MFLQIDANQAAYIDSWLTGFVFQNKRVGLMKFNKIGDISNKNTIFAAAFIPALW